MRRTKIIATVGPASASVEVLSDLAALGVDVFRLNFSHGSHAEHRERVRRIRQVCRREGRQAAIIQDLCGPKIRSGEMQDGWVLLRRDAEVTITTADVPGTATRFGCNYGGLPDDARAGGRILLDDGKLALRVLSISGQDVLCRVERGGRLHSRKGMNLPHTDIGAPSVTPKDLADLEVGLEEGVDFVALSFVRQADDVQQMKELLAKRGSDAQVIAKIEKPEAVACLDQIVAAADGILVARGDLGVEMELERVPVLQKDIVRCANEQDKYVIVATQMLDSMVQCPVPTRAEVSDVSNAVLDGADAVMLSGETAVGTYPREAVGMLDRITRHSESYASRYRPPWDWSRINPVHPVQDAVALAAFDLCRDLKAAAIVAFSATGGTALFLSRNRPAAPVVAFTSDDAAFRRMRLFWGVRPVLDASITTKAGLIERANVALQEQGLARVGDAVIIVAGSHFGQVGSTNGVEVATVV